ncbi:MAG: enoyl-CoA hydratase/isomerase family protein [Acidimicrobiales bacterium]
MAEHATTLATDRGVATVTLARPENRNALSAELVDSLGDHLQAAAADTSVRVIVLTNEGTVFCAGADLMGGGAEPRYSLVDLFDSIAESPKPVIGRIAGHCMGGGVGLAASCDISIISDDALVGFTEVRIGVAPAIISVVCLPKMRRADAAELFLSGERISAARAVEVGLLNRAVPPDELDHAVADVVAKVVAGGPQALAAAKRLIRDVPGQDRETAFAWTAELSAELFASEEAATGIGSWRDKTDAPWIP